MDLDRNEDTQKEKHKSFVLFTLCVSCVSVCVCMSPWNEEVEVGVSLCFLFQVGMNNEEDTMFLKSKESKEL